MSDATGVVNGQRRIDEGEMRSLRLIGRLRRRLLGRRRGVGVVARAGADDGFSLIETVIALGLVFTVMLGLLASLSTGIRGLSTGRQRTGATSIAKETVERARAATYDDVGHDLGDGSIATDPEITVDVDGDYVYAPDALTGPEALVGSANPVFATHLWEETRDNVSYTVRVYVTEVAGAVGDDHKRLTVDVTWDNGQYEEEAVAPEIKVSTYVARFGIGISQPGIFPPGGTTTTTDPSAPTTTTTCCAPPPPTYYPYGEGIVDVDSGAVTITGTLSGANLAQAQLFFPLVHADSQADVPAVTRGLAGSARSSLALTSGTPSGCTVSASTATCNGVKAETAADDDHGTIGIDFQDVVGPLSDIGGSVASGGVLSLSLGTSGTVTSKSSAQSCASVGCIDGPVGDGDLLVYAENDARGPASMSAGFTAGVVTGSLVDLDDDGSATATIDQDAVSGSSFFDSVGELVVPAVDLVNLEVGPLGFTSAVRVSSVEVAATAQAGPTAGLPSVTGSPITVSMYETGPLGGAYTDVTFTPGETVDESRTASFGVDVLGVANTVTLETTVRAGQETTSSSVDGSVRTEARANLTNWFVVNIHLVVEDSLGGTVADLNIELDYGRLSVLSKVTQ